MTTIENLDRASAVARMTEIHERMEAIAQKHRTSRADDEEFGQGQAEFNELQRHVEKLDRCAAIAGAAGGGNGRLRIERGSIQPYQDAGSERLGGLRESALRQLDRSVKAGFPLPAPKSWSAWWIPAPTMSARGRPAG